MTGAQMRKTTPTGITNPATLTTRWARFDFNQLTIGTPVLKQRHTGFERAEGEPTLQAQSSNPKGHSSFVEFQIAVDKLQVTCCGDEILTVAPTPQHCARHTWIVPV